MNKVDSFSCLSPKPIIYSVLCTALCGSMVWLFGAIIVLSLFSSFGIFLFGFLLIENHNERSIERRPEHSYLIDLDRTLKESNVFSPKESTPSEKIRVKMEQDNDYFGYNLEENENNRTDRLNLGLNEESTPLRTKSILKKDKYFKGESQQLRFEDIGDRRVEYKDGLESLEPHHALETPQPPEALFQETNHFKGGLNNVTRDSML
ncbi:unnamed protein product [Brachionus calyciflorus]|uniref:Uncharacterized protein n=1 Tax=Brachionus calyciflorus TaxID=104777 RepID=A0A814BDJ4_9BILA|nr:unnamed protein product [Brachionus calyciflorus]